MEKRTPTVMSVLQTFFFWLEETNFFLKKNASQAVLKNCINTGTYTKQSELLPTAGSGQDKEKPAKHQLREKHKEENLIIW